MGRVAPSVCLPPSAATPADPRHLQHARHRVGAAEQLGTSRAQERGDARGAPACCAAACRARQGAEGRWRSALPPAALGEPTRSRVREGASALGKGGETRGRPTARPQLH
ncbi:hypothetical protein C2845_PM14G05560 [Panicum miliaceum]|uniref:Uncharacterized protein n=1 Tax=Panicum miliaceum TaxID=4540 RepID=A0A3L6PPU5_PANMI|nr:hypothetical protein C2845_PM14G05560 [Panicum miliaceum]